jgi:hypothetical protein
MWAVTAIYDNGHLAFPEGTYPEGRMEVVVVFPDQAEPCPPRDKEAGKRFVEEWSGILKGTDIEGWKDRKAADLERRHK